MPIRICKLILVFFVVFFTCSEASVAQSPTPRPSLNSLSTNPTPSKDFVEVKMTVLGVDPVKRELEARIQFQLKGIYKVAPTYPAQDLLLTVNAANQLGSQITFLEGKPMEVSSLKFNIIKGKTNRYPFDRHIARVALSLDPLPSQDKNFAPFDVQPVPLALKFEADVPGFEITYTPQRQNSTIFIFIDISISRSIPVKIFGIVIILIMWVLSILTLLLALKVLQAGKVPEVGMLSWMSVMLFAFPTIRNTQPGVPPVGTVSDFLSLFWTETIVVISLTILGVCWLKRYHVRVK